MRTSPKGGFFPDMCLYLTYFYTSNEMNIRMSWFYTVLGVSQIIGSLLSIALLNLNGLFEIEGWRYLFGTEACISLLVGFRCSSTNAINHYQDYDLDYSKAMAFNA